MSDLRTSAVIEVTFAIAMALALMLLARVATADEPDARIAALEKRIETLEARIRTLESSRTLTALMPNFAERFHVMHLAGETGDWAVASHELAEMRRIGALARSIDQERGALLASMMSASFESLGKAIEHGDTASFEDALRQAIGSCNACHAATGSAFIEVTLDVPDALSMRHPHRLKGRGVPEGHVHGTHGRGGTGMHGGEEAERNHDDAGKPPHTH